MVSMRLELLAPVHLPHMQALADDPLVAQYTRFPVPLPPNFVEEWYARYEAGRKAGTREAFAALNQDGEFVGVALAPSIDAEAAEMELGYIVAPSARGRGYGSEMLRQLTTWAFLERNAKRLVLLIDVHNRASQRVARAAGYQLEGVMRSSYFKQGLRSDCQMWSRLTTDPPAPLPRRS
jgi:RimJ/RimL family protein N-acetyltransferase